MKILLVNNTIFYEKDEELYLNKETGNFFCKLKNIGNEISLFQISQLKTEKDNFANFSISNKGMHVYEVKRRKSRIFAFFKAFFVVQKAILRNDFIYIFYPGPICKVISILCILYRKPFGLYVRGEQGISTAVSKFILKRASNVFTISPKFTQSILEFNKRVYTIRPMIGFNEDDIVIERKINLSEQIELLYVGRLVYDKGLFELIDALEVLFKKGVNVFLNLVGGGTDYDNLLHVVKEKGLIERVKFHGMISEKKDLVELYKSCNVFVLPTYHEGFPRVLYEAMIMRIPIITTFVGTINFLMTDEYNCLQILPKSVDSIVENIEKLINDPVLGQVIADNGANTIAKYLYDKKMDHSEQLNSNLVKI
ncbi:glycosyltransferase family 4 protein [Sphingobacterium sp. BIGb0116]|uniref:glycosyltransferase family 4 protein n=1 Tax=Sphingobacterium sp. BIGb0116 TaxID=2940619 RepID=UPI00216821F6|nr:glycosyltransferase family 4 protein [Sphingobacterium sp. BIGb0116]MCS4166236.1 glycosyltransferase involved in cell wall biosynthesis [Sphingobacterium sp. BIGb0116]